MNITDFAHQVLDMQDELYSLRSRNAYLEEELEKYHDHVEAQIEGHQQMWGKLLSAAIDPKSRLNNMFNKE
jgi:hypothetical protein